ncbi:WAT1-related protein [Senna tora]|uniref:WAT1-related protein n=1 Tax=Senna tora TaxID=362788 RepID=A0A834SJF1_9FABA|nr:WAT1-related protein [Senna tora]
MTLTFFKGIQIHTPSFHVNLLHHPPDAHVASPHSSSATHTLLAALSAVSCCFSYALWLIIQGIVVSGIMWVVMSWCIHMRGPLFVSVFNPLMLVIVAVAGCLMLEEKLYLGTIIGGVVIVCGLYMVLWGKGKEMKKKNQLVPSHTLREIIAKSPPNDQNQQEICA